VGEAQDWFMQSKRMWRICGRALVATVGASSNTLAQAEAQTVGSNNSTLVTVPPVESQAGTAIVGQSETPPTAQERAAAVSQLEALRPKIAELTLRVSDADANIFFDDLLIGQTPLSGPLRCDAGAHRLRIEKAGFVSYTETLQLNGGESVSRSVSLVSLVDQGLLRIITDGAADVLVDGTPRGKGFWSGSLPVGQHRVDVTAAEKLPYHLDVTITRQQPYNLRAMLTNRSSDQGFDKTWFWVLGSVLLAASLGVAGYHQFIPDRREPSSVVGTLAPGRVPVAHFSR
jgi:hypothetical protein